MLIQDLDVLIRRSRAIRQRGCGHEVLPCCAGPSVRASETQLNRACPAARGSSPKSSSANKAIAGCLSPKANPAGGTLDSLPSQGLPSTVEGP
jgi:hypothetical protein